jgi:hypothetical protein
MNILSITDMHSTQIRHRLAGLITSFLLASACAAPADKSTQQLALAAPATESSEYQITFEGKLSEPIALPQTVYFHWFNYDNTSTYQKVGVASEGTYKVSLRASDLPGVATETEKFSATGRYAFARVELHAEANLDVNVPLAEVVSQTAPKVYGVYLLHDAVGLDTVSEVRFVYKVGPVLPTWGPLPHVRNLPDGFSCTTEFVYGPESADIRSVPCSDMMLLNTL